MSRFRRAVESSSIFTTISQYLGDVGWAIRSVFGSCYTSIPYLFSAGEFRKEVTEQYPDPISSKSADDLPPRSRGILFNDIERCTGCRECEKACPTGCILIETDIGPDLNNVWVSTFDIDFAKCTLCGLCVENCAPASLYHTKQYESAVYSPSDLVARFGRGNVTLEQRDKWALLRSQREEDEVHQ